jgi:predicted DCC family thiol-disulfide oxidoreductase YuxK
MPETPPVIFFDGHCRLCSRAVSFVISHDRKKIFRFAPLQSAHGQKALQGLAGFKQTPDTIVLAENEKFYFRSTAILRILKRLGGGWPLLYIFIIVPAGVRDYLYDLVARYRYRWFGRKEECTLVPPDRIDQ